MIPDSQPSHFGKRLFILLLICIGVQNFLDISILLAAEFFCQVGEIILLGLSNSNTMDTLGDVFLHIILYLGLKVLMGGIKL